MTATDTRPLPPVPTFPFSMFDPVHLGRDEYGQPVYVNLAERNMLLGGEPGAGKSSGLNLIVAHGALSYRLQAHPGRRQASRARHVARAPPTGSSARPSKTPSRRSRTSSTS